MDRVPKTHSLQVNGLHFFQLNLKTVNIIIKFSSSRSSARVVVGGVVPAHGVEGS
jgi:hypothetical protein